MKDDKVQINFILDSIRKTERYISGIDREFFMQNELIQSGILMQLILIGENIKKISDDTKKKIDLPWKNIVGFRDKAIHNYFEMDLDVIWDTIQNDIPELKAKLLEYR